MALTAWSASCYTHSAGLGATVPGGHPTQMDGALARLMPTLTAPGDADAFVAARLAEGSDFIKIIYDDIERYGQKLPTLDEATVAALATGAHALGRIAVARAFRMSDRGRISTGMRADLLLVDGDPSKQVRATRNIVAIWKRGVRV
jgi:hypothetical protein